MGSIPGLRRSPGGGILAWEIPWTEEPGGLQSMVLQRVGHVTAAHQAPLSLGFSRQEHWSGLPFPSPMHESEK